MDDILSADQVRELKRIATAPRRKSMIDPYLLEKMWTFEGPAYADRVNGKLTFRDWDHWTKEDQDKWRDDPRAPKASD